MFYLAYKFCMSITLICNAKEVVAAECMAHLDPSLYTRRVPYILCRLWKAFLITLFYYVHHLCNLCPSSIIYIFCKKLYYFTSTTPLN